MTSFILPCAFRFRRGVSSAGFSLVELLVVIGIIALLVSILMPALATIRESANSTRCAAQEREILQAMFLHAEQHGGYMPMTGRPPVNPDPQSLGDPGMIKYDYYKTASGQLHLMSVMGSLAPQLSQTVDTSSLATVNADLQRGTLRQIFHCPSDNNERLGATVDNGGQEYSSYAFNEAPLGMATSVMWDGSGLISLPHAHRRMRGKVSDFVHPETLFLFTDAVPRFDGWLLYCDGGAELTLRDIFVTTSGPPNNPNASFSPPPGYCACWDLIDTRRHRGRMNVAFADSHVESVSIDEGSLSKISMNIDFPP